MCICVRVYVCLCCTKAQKGRNRQTPRYVFVCMLGRQAGTFEERNATSWAKGRLGELVKGLEGLAGGDVSVLDLNSCEGEANIFLVRGKKR